MSRIGRSPITGPSSVTIDITSDSVTVKGPNGTLERTIPGEITIRQEGEILTVERPNDERQNRALHGLTRSLVANMIIGVTDGFTKELDIVGVGYRAQAKGPGSLELALGFFQLLLSFRGVHHVPLAQHFDGKPTKAHTRQVGHVGPREQCRDGPTKRSRQDRHHHQGGQRPRNDKQARAGRRRTNR